MASTSGSGVMPYSDQFSSMTSVEGPEYGATLDEYRPFVKVDLESTREIEPDHFLAALAKIDLESLRDADKSGKLKGELGKMEKIAAHSDVLQLRDAYCTSANGSSGIKETARCGLFARLANKIIELLCGTKDTPIAFRRNDPHQLGGVLNNFRTPDVVVIDGSHESVKDGKWKNYSRMNCRTSRDTRYTWADIPFTVEFKLGEDPILVGEQSTDAEPRSVSQTNRPSARSAPTHGETIPRSIFRAQQSSRGTRRSTMTGEHIASRMSSINPQLESSVGRKRSLPVEFETETEGSRSKRPRNNNDSNRAPGNLCVQGLCYAIEQFSYLHILRHIYNVLVIDGKIWMCYYDHTGIIRTSQPLDFVNDLFRFVLLLKCMMDMSKVERGISEHITRNEDKGPSLVSNDRAKVDALVPIAKSGTVLKITQKEAKPKSVDLIAQFSLYIKGQVFRFIRRLVNTGYYELLGKATEVVEAKLVRLEGNVAKCPIGIGKIVALEGCLPVVYESEDQDDLVEAEGCFRQRLNLLKFVDGVENRVWRTIVFELLIPIYMLDDLKKFKKCFRGIFQGHHFLWIHGIMHRDISVGNLMCRLGKGGRACGVLNDWDLAKLKDSKESTSNSRTGTRPFMARDLLTDEPVEHLERFDWESMLYVLIWIACCYGPGGKVVNDNPLPSWFEHDLGILEKDKASVCGGGFPPFTEHYRGLRTRWIHPMVRLFQSGYSWKLMGHPTDESDVEEPTDETGVEERADETEVEERTYDVNELNTLGGYVTYEKLRDIYRL
ncbi:hypothetical protein M0805_004063 [Coniferiporia weirii]|nr:hypothetical protein M0805_004063 [Coniferiporia weirii]